VLIQNQATAGLYNYTPYQPNAAALAAGYGTGDSCSAYGNRNFWLYFRDWFGPTTQRAPIGVIDSVATTPSSVTVSGWALDPDVHDPIGVHIFVDGAWAGAGTAASPRPDVGAAYGKGDLHGYQITVAATPGPHRVCAYAIDATGGTNPEIGCRTVTVVNNAPRGVIDYATVSGSTVTVGGWAFDPDTTDSIGVHLYVDGVWTTATYATAPRADVNAAYGIGGDHGWSAAFTTTTGTHNVCAYGIDTGGGTNPQMACRTVTVPASAQQRVAPGDLESATQDATTATVSGWSLVDGPQEPAQLRVEVDGAVVAHGSATQVRPDLPGGADPALGYVIEFPAVVDGGDVCVLREDSDAETTLGCTPLPPTDTATGVIDTVTTGDGSVTLSGWALDLRSSEPLSLDVLVDGAPAGTVLADALRPDVGQVYGLGDAHGYSITVPATSGQHEVCLRRTSTDGTTGTELACTTVAVP
jgi:hypothetical protein